jgi:hypothetical protein
MLLALFTALGGLFAFLLAIGLIATFFIACRYFELVFGITLALLCLDAITVGLPIFSIGKNIQIFDPLAIIAFLAALARIGFGFTKNVTTPHWLQLSMLALMVVPLAAGFKMNGMAAAPDFRWFFHFLAFSLYASSFDFEQINFDRLVKYTLIAGATVALLIYFRWVAEAAGLSIANSWFHVGAGRRFRVINAAQTYLLAQAALLLLITKTVTIKKPTAVSEKEIAGLLRGSAIAIAGLGLATAFALMHRSVWVCSIAGMVALSIVAPEFRRQVTRMAWISGLGLMIVLVPLSGFGYLDHFFDALVKSLSEVGDHHSSFADRYLGWQALLQGWWEQGNFLTYATGQPFGSGYYRRIAEFGSSYFAEYTPHNFYIQILLRTGVLGIVLFGALIATTVIALYRNIRTGGLNMELTTTTFQYFLLLAVTMQMVFMFAYGARLEHGLFFGLAMSAVASQNRQHRVTTCRLTSP